MYHRMVIRIVLLGSSLSGLTQRIRICNSNGFLQGTLVTFTRNHASPRSLASLIIYGYYTDYLVATYSRHTFLIQLIVFLNELIILSCRLLVERVVNWKVQIVMVDSMLAALNRQLFTTPHFRRCRLLQDFQDSVVISCVVLGLLSRAQTHELLMLRIISVIPIMKQLLGLQVDFIQIVVNRRSFQLL